MKNVKLFLATSLACVLSACVSDGVTVPSPTDDMTKEQIRRKCRNLYGGKTMESMNATESCLRSRGAL